MATEIDKYLARQKAMAHRITETHKSIRFYKKRQGMARHQARDKIRDMRKMLEMFEWMKENDSLPWEPGPTLEMDALATHYLTRLDDEITP